MDKQTVPHTPRAQATQAARSSRRGWVIAAVVILIVLFWTGIAVLVGTGKTSFVAVDEAPFNLDKHPVAAASLEPRALLPPALNKDTQTLVSATADEAVATYIGDRAEARITVRRYADENAARAAVVPIGQAVPDPKQQRQRTGTAARDYYQ